jgi:hypothetical protein
MRTAEQLLVAFMEECFLVSDGGTMALVDSSWVDVTPEELAYLESINPNAEDAK